MCGINGYMYVPTCMLVCVYAHACVGHRLTLGIFVGHSLPYILNRISHLGSDLPDLARLTSHLAPSVYCLWLPNARATDRDRKPYLAFKWCLESTLHSSYLHCKCFIHWAISPVPGTGISNDAIAHLESYGMLLFLKFCPECLCVRHLRFGLGTKKCIENGKNKMSSIPHHS